MIRSGHNRYRDSLKALWKVCFPADTDRFVDFYFDAVYRNNETLLCLVDDRPVAAMQIIPYTLAVGDAVHLRKGGYLSGIMTHPDYRRQGHMHRLLTTALDRMPEQGYDYTFLIPQRKELIEMYAQYGFRLCAANPEPPVNRVLKTPAQWAILRQDYFDEKGIRLDTEPFFPHEQKGMLRRLHPDAEAIDTLYMGLMLD